MATVDNAILQAHYRQAVAKGIFDDQLMVQSGLDLDRVQRGEGRSDAKAFATWLAEHWRANNDEAGGFLDSPVQNGSFAMSMHAVISAGNLRRALIRSGHFYQLVNAQLNFTLEERGEEAHLIVSIDAPVTDELRVFFDALLVLWLRWSSWLIDRPLLLDRVHIPFALPAYAAEYDYMYRCNVFEHQPDCRAVFSSDYLQLPIVKTPQDLTEFLANAPGNLLVHFQQQESVSAKVLEAFNAMPSAGGLDQNDIAGHIGVSVPTLRRQLKSEGSSFQNLKDQWRRKQAMHYLRNSQKPLTDISEELGFSEPSAFSRAFKKWTGHNPGDYRE